MTPNQRPLHDLSRKECLEFLQYHSFVGRLGFVLDGRPMVLPVNYLADEEAVVFCTAEGTTLSAVAEGSEVVFEVDDSHPLERSGWSVVVRGPARVVTDPAEVDALRRGPLRSWVARSPGAVGPDHHPGGHRPAPAPDRDPRPRLSSARRQLVGHLAARSWAQIAARKTKPSRATATITSRAVSRAQATVSSLRTRCAMDASSIRDVGAARVQRWSTEWADGGSVQGRSSLAFQRE